MGEGEQPQGDRNVVKERDDRGHAVDRLEAQADVDQHSKKRQPHGERRASPQIGSHDRPDALHPLDRKRARIERALEALDRRGAHAGRLLEVVERGDEPFPDLVPVVEEGAGRGAVMGLDFLGRLALLAQPVGIGIEQVFGERVQPDPVEIALGRADMLGVQSLAQHRLQLFLPLVDRVSGAENHRHAHLDGVLRRVVVGLDDRRAGRLGPQGSAQLVDVRPLVELQDHDGAAREINSVGQAAPHEVPDDPDQDQDPGEAEEVPFLSEPIDRYVSE